MSDLRKTRIPKPDQWFDPTLLLPGNGSEYWARWATWWLYWNVVSPTVPSEEWPKYGIITQFDRHIDIPIGPAVGGVPTVSAQFAIPTNNRNWLLVSRAATVLDTNGNNLNLSDFDVTIELPNNTQVIETQPISNVFGSGEWPHVMFFPEEWEANVSRAISIRNRSLFTANVFLSFKFLQVRNP